MSKFLNALLTPLGIKRAGFERIGQEKHLLNQLEMESYDDSDNEAFELFCVTEFTEMDTFPAFDYDEAPQFFQRHEKLCYLVDKNVLSFAMKRVAQHLQSRGLGSYGIASDIKACEIDPNVLIAQASLPLTDYPMTLSGSVPTSALADIITRDDSRFFRNMEAELRKRRCRSGDWRTLGIHRIPSTVAAFVCMNATPDFVQDANDAFTIEDIADYCVHEEKQARRIRQEAMSTHKQTRRSRSRKSPTPEEEEEDVDTEVYNLLRERVRRQCNVGSIMRLDPHHRWYRVPYWMLDFVANHITDDTDSTSMVAGDEKKTKKKKKRAKSNVSPHPSCERKSDKHASSSLL